MAARDEGLDKLEAFIAAAAEARASLQRGADTLEDLRSQVERLEDDAEKRLQAFEDALEELVRDMRPAVEHLLPLILVIVVGTVLFGPAGGAAAALLVIAGQKYGPALQERLAELAEEWPALTDEISEDLLSTLEQETSEVTRAVREYMEAVEEEMEATAEEHDEVSEAFEEAEQVLEKGAGAVA